MYSRYLLLLTIVIISTYGYSNTLSDYYDDVQGLQEIEKILNSAINIILYICTTMGIIYGGLELKNDKTRAAIIIILSIIAGSAKTIATNISSNVSY